MMKLMVTSDYYIEFSERLNATLDYIGFPPKGKARQIKFGPLFGVGQRGAGKWLSGEGMPHQKRHAKIIKFLNDNGAGITG